MIIHYFVLLCFICFSGCLFYFTIFKRTFKNQSAKLFLRDPSSSPTFIKYLLAQDRNNCITALDSRTKNQKIGLGAQPGANHHPEGESWKQRSKAIKVIGWMERNPKRTCWYNSLLLAQVEGCAYKQGHGEVDVFHGLYLPWEAMKWGRQGPDHQRKGEPSAALLIDLNPNWCESPSLAFKTFEPVVDWT